MDPLAGIPINTLTAGPLLRLMLAMEGMEPDSMPVEEAWPVFKRFAALPSQANGDVISFQVRQGGEPGSPMYYCMWIRQLSDEAGGWGERTRSIQLEFMYDHGPQIHFSECEVWSDDFDSLDSFSSHVERLPLRSVPGTDIHPIS